MGRATDDHEKEKKDVEEIIDHTNLSPKVRLEEEKKNLQKAQRTHERMLKKLEEASARTATREAKFHLRVIIWCSSCSNNQGT